MTTIIHLSSFASETFDIRAHLWPEDITCTYDQEERSPKRDHIVPNEGQSPEEHWQKKDARSQASSSPYEAVCSLCSTPGIYSSVTFLRNSVQKKLDPGQCFKTYPLRWGTSKGGLFALEIHSN